MQWEDMIKKTKSSPLIKVLLKGNAKRLLLVFSGALAVVFFDSIDVMFYSQVVSNLDNNPLDIPKIPLLPAMIFLLMNYFLYAITFRSLEAYTAIFSFKLISQLDALVYDKLLRISPYNNISEGALVNFIQSDTENFGEFFTYTPATLVQPVEIIYFIYLLFSYFGFVFIFAIITLVIIFIIFAKLEKVKAKYQKEVLIKKDRRMTTTTQAFEMISIVKLYSWEDYFLNKISREREDELVYLKKAQIVSLFIDCITWSIGPILSFVSVFSYNLFHEPMQLPKLLTSLYIFHNLTDPLFLIPEYVNGLIDSLLSLRRLEAFLFSKEYVPSQMTKMHKNEDNLKLNYENDNIKNHNKNNNILEKEKINIGSDCDSENGKLNCVDHIIPKNNHNGIYKEVMIEINNLDFGIIKREEEFKIIEENEEEEEDDDDNEVLEEHQKEKKVSEESHIVLIEEKKMNSTDKGNEVKIDKTKKEEDQKNNNKKQQEKIQGTVIVPLLKEINLKIYKGNLIGIIGEFGSGKSCLFNAILNNLDILNNDDNKKIYLNGTVAYVPQKSWILNETVRNNIIFNKLYDEQKYNKIVDICQLKPDFELLQHGDLTSISDKGDNLSGGQKTRLSIARAVYSDADIYLFDDPFSALDADVGKLIFYKTIKEYLNGKTILLITHALQYIPMMDYIIKMNDGKIVYYGNVKDAEKQSFYKDFVSSNQKKNIEEAIINNIKENKNAPKEEIDNDDSGKFLYKIRTSNNNTLILSKNDKYDYKKPSIIQVLKIVFSYSGGYFILLFIIFLNAFWKMCDSGSDFIITKWSNAEVGKEKSLFTYYLLTKLLSIVFVFLKSYVIVYALIAFNKNIHKALLYRLLRGPINLFHNIVSKSHIINRFSKDIGNSIKYFWSLNSIIVVLFHITNGIFIAACLFWKIIFIIPFLVLLDFFLYKYYIKSAKGLNTLEIYTRVPILSTVKETLSGITSIRAYESKEIFQNLFHRRLHDFYRVLVYQTGCASWFALNIDFVSFVFLFFILIFIWRFKDIIGGGPLGIALNYVLKLIEHSYNFFDYLNKNERMSTSMESCDAYTHIVQEAPLHNKTDDMLIKKKISKIWKNRIC